jgi:hypothetical protein
VKTAAAVAWAALGWAASAAAMAQGGPDELWSMTTKMEMAGMQMPGSTQQVCMKKGETRPESLQQDKNCKVTEFGTMTFVEDFQASTSQPAHNLVNASFARF